MKKTPKINILARLVVEQNQLDETRISDQGQMCEKFFFLINLGPLSSAVLLR